ncbi:hypothetical protein D9757_000960 [Collybiopsis confluens]|uniref:F-box domain-containing protein n=1 Tax=Collybiopsis confluens TaxID=2823264 RepID=A0A8H5I0E9_9AGAR|nr:hypothetical protein D9757_000960 [Collybiopsis confluens]
MFLRSERIFPNELFALIVGNLMDDRSSLRNLALVCKDFAQMSQSILFRAINLDGLSIWGHSYPAGLRYQHHLKSFLRTSSILRFVQQLDVFPNKFFNAGDAARILGDMTSLTAFTLISPKLGHIHAIGSSLPSTLKILCINRLDAADVGAFASTLLLLKSLEALAMTSICVRLTEKLDIVFPRSLKTAFFRTVSSDLLQAIGSGLKSSPLPSLRSIVLDDIFSANSQVPAVLDCSRLWHGLGTDTQIVFVERPFPEAAQAFRATKLIWMWRQYTELAKLLCVTHVSSLPPSVCELVIELDAGEISGQHLPLIPGHREDWSRLDDILVQRHRRGLLTLVCVRCTRRDGFFQVLGPSLCSKGFDRSILEHIEILLPKSKITGFLQVDRDMEDFAPTM